MIQELNEQEFDALQLSGDWILTEPKQQMDQVEMPSGIKFHLDPSFDLGRHVPKLQVVVKTYPGSKLKEGDQVIANYLAVWNAIAVGTEKEHIGDPRMIRFKGRDYLLVREGMIHAKLDPLVMMNDDFLVQRIEEDESDSVEIVHNPFAQQKAEWMKGLVLHCPDGYQALEGKVVYFMTWDIVEFEYLYRNVVGERGKQLYRINLSNIAAAEGKALPIPELP